MRRFFLFTITHNEQSYGVFGICERCAVELHRSLYGTQILKYARTAETTIGGVMA